MSAGPCDERTQTPRCEGGFTRALREGLPEGQRLCDISQALVPDVLASLPLSLPPLSSLTRLGHFAVGLDRPNETEAGGR